MKISVLELRWNCEINSSHLCGSQIHETASASVCHKLVTVIKGEYMSPLLIIWLVVGKNLEISNYRSSRFLISFTWQTVSLMDWALSRAEGDNDWLWLRGEWWPCRVSAVVDEEICAWLCLDVARAAAAFTLVISNIVLPPVVTAAAVL